MPKRSDIGSVLIIGSGPIVIGQACEFDYSGTQACKSLRDEGIRVVLINSNPATIMTDPETADATYIEPLTVEVLDRILSIEKVDAILPTLGGQTALNLAIAASKAGLLEKHGVELIGAQLDSIEMAEDRELFKQAMTRIGLATPRSTLVTSLTEARACIDEVGFPAILRPSFTMGGAGAAIAYNASEFDRLVQSGLDQSPRTEILVEQSVLGWKEYEFEVMRDKMDNVVIICTIENFDPMGIHTGDSITVAPAMTLTDREFQRMRDAALAVIREVGVETGGANIQFAINPANGDQIVIEMNPRVSRPSALASKATGFPIAKLAAKLAIGYSLDEIQNDITKVTPASFEPSIDYVVVKMPRFTFEKFPGAEAILGTQMKSVGEAMSIGRTFRSALGKALRSLETGGTGLDLVDLADPVELERQVASMGPERIYYLAQAFRTGMSLERAFELSHIDPWFLRQVELIVELEESLRGIGLADLDAQRTRELKQDGLSDARIATLLGVSEENFRKHRKSLGIIPSYKRVDTCAAEFAADTPYLYSSYDEECEAEPSLNKKVIILGGGPNRIGQGIEFDYCCVHAVQALREDGYETIMINCNPETVSTDYDTADRLYFEPLTLEDVLAVCDLEKPVGVVLQFGGQTPLTLAKKLQDAGIPLLGTSANAIDRAEDRERFGALLAKLGLAAPKWGIARTLEEAHSVASDIGFPVMVRPSYVLGGRAMERVYEAAQLDEYFARAEKVGLPVLIDQFLDNAIELDLDLVADKTGASVIGGVMEHIEEAGIHSGDSACSLPSYSLSAEIIEEIKVQGKALAKELGVVGLMNMQVAVVSNAAGTPDKDIYIIEVNPRASRTVPFVSKASGQPLAKIAATLMMGKTLEELGVEEARFEHTCVKESVFPFLKFDAVDTLLGPEMRSTGEVMGLDSTFAHAFAKAQEAAGNALPSSGRAFLSLRTRDKAEGAKIARGLHDLGFSLVATSGTAAALRKEGLPVDSVKKVLEGHPHCVDAMSNGEIDLVVNTTEGSQAIIDSKSLRRTALTCGISYFTTIRAARAALCAIQARLQDGIRVQALQNYHQKDQSHG